MAGWPAAAAPSSRRPGGQETAFWCIRITAWLLKLWPCRTTPSRCADDLACLHIPALPHQHIIGEFSNHSGRDTMHPSLRRVGDDVLVHLGMHLAAGAKAVQNHSKQMHRPPRQFPVRNLAVASSCDFDGHGGSGSMHPHLLPDAEQQKCLKTDDPTVLY
jgi:hypothetical protein